MKISSKLSDLVLYRSKDGSVQLDVQLEKESIWLDTHQMAVLFSRDRTVILRHLANIYKTKELGRNSTCAKIAQVAAVFLRFADKNLLLYNKDGSKIIADNALVAMTLMIAESRPTEKDVITAMVTNLISKI